jgi:hypothetical protein
MQHDPDHDPCRHALARQVLDECERSDLRVWQQNREGRQRGANVAIYTDFLPRPSPVGT